MILVNYLEPAIYRMAGVDSKDGMSAFLSEPLTEGRVGRPWVGLWMVSLGVAPSWGSLERVGPSGAGLPIFETAGIQRHSGTDSWALYK